jgi:hypothetical protein
MHDIEKLDTVIQEIEASSTDLKNIRVAYQELLEMGSSLDSMAAKTQSKNAGDAG